MDKKSVLVEVDSDDLVLANSALLFMLTHAEESIASLKACRSRIIDALLDAARKREPAPPPVVAETGIFTDERDGQSYKTVKMPDGKVWMAENLNYETEEGSWYYDNDTEYAHRHGRLYIWDAAKAACPEGWHLSTCEEWAALVEACGGKDVAGKKLKARSGWNEDGNGTDDYGFSALPGGGRYSDGDFGNAGYLGFWWTATENGDFIAYRRGMFYGLDYVYEDLLNYNDKDFGFSVRCVKDN